MRNKIGHGDFSRLNWILLNVCCVLDDLLRKVIKVLFEDKQKLIEIKNE